MGSVGEFIEACVCPYCFILNDKGHVELGPRPRLQPLYRRFDGRRRFASHLRKRHPGSLMLATIKAEA